MALLLMVLIINGRKEDFQEKKYKLVIQKNRGCSFNRRGSKIERTMDQQTEYLSVSSVTNKNYTESVRK